MLGVLGTFGAIAGLVIGIIVQALFGISDRLDVLADRIAEGQKDLGVVKHRLDALEERFPVRFTDHHGR